MKGQTAFLCFVAAMPMAQAAGWVYANSGKTAANAADQAATWGGLCVTGNEQSPINIDTGNVAATGTPSITTSIADGKMNYVKTTGHGFQIFETSPNHHATNGSTEQEFQPDAAPKGYSMINGAKYNFYQVHFHTPSENTINGQNMAIEAHFVHQLNDANLHGTYHNLAVIGLMYELGTASECNADLAKFWDKFPVNAAGTVAYNGTQVDWNAKLQAELAQGYYHWYGSLTTPPCTEGVSWNLLKATEKVCPAQVDKLKTALGNLQSGINFNNRVTMPLNNRYVADVKVGNPSSSSTQSTMPAAGAWKYAATGGTVADATVQQNTWGGLCATGHEQSPINIVTANTKNGTGDIATCIDTKMTYVKNSGHGLQIFETSPSDHSHGGRRLGSGGSTVDSVNGTSKGYSMINGDKYNFYQVHWHTPSENSIDGQLSSMEAHFVHQLDDTALHGGYHRLAVIGLMYELDTSASCSNPILDKFWDSFPVDAAGTAAYTGQNIDFNAKLAHELAQGYYHWRGSLTTPPCTEGVSWNLLKTKETVCQKHLDRLKAALQATQVFQFNNRVTMPLNNRVVSDVTNSPGQHTCQAGNPAGTAAGSSTGVETSGSNAVKAGLTTILFAALTSTFWA